MRFAPTARRDVHRHIAENVTDFFSEFEQFIFRIAKAATATADEFAA